MMADKVSGVTTLNKKPVADFASPPMEPPADPAARSYAARIQERAASKVGANALKGKPVPLGHVKSPDPEKMAAIAGLSMQRPEFDPGPPPTETQTPKAEKPAGIPGVGAAYPVNQALAQGKTNGPVTLREANQMAAVTPKTLSDDTVRALEAVNQNVQSAQESEKPAAPIVIGTSKSEFDDAEKSFEPAPFDSMDFASLADVRQTLMSQKRRDEVEKRLAPLEIADMIIKRELTQVIPIIPGRLEVSLRTFSQRENLWILKYLYDFPGSSLYVQELLNTCRLVCSLVAINGSYLPDHRQDVGTTTEKILKEDFEKKFFHVASFPVQLVADLSVQAMWFQDRVDKLFTVDALKNG
jgi:hypothetical protein